MTRATATRGPRVPEKVEQANIVRLLRGIGAAVYVLGTRRRQGDYPGTMQTPGLPDLYVVLPVDARPLWIEVKAHGGRLRPEQQDFRLHCERADIAHLVGGVDDVLRWLEARGYLVAPARVQEG